MQTNWQVEKISENIARLRREKGWTQEALASQLGITFQAVSKWEMGNSCPDIALLPALCQVFGVSLDALFGLETAREREKAKPRETCAPDLPDDGALRILIYRGRTQLTEEELCYMRFTYVHEGEALDVYCPGNLECGDVNGNAQAGGSIECSDINGSAEAGEYINCEDIGGYARAGGNIDCGDIGGDATAACDLNCGDIGGDAVAGGHIECGDIAGSAQVGDDSYIKCGDIGGGAQANGDGNIDCGDIHSGGALVTGVGNIGCGDIYSGGARAGKDIACGSISGGAQAGGNIECHDVHTGGEAVTVGGNLTCGEISTGDGPVTVNGSLKVGGDLNCAGINQG